MCFKAKGFELKIVAGNSFAEYLFSAKYILLQRGEE